MRKKISAMIGVAALAVAGAACDSEPYEAGTVGGGDSVAGANGADDGHDDAPDPEPTPNDTEDAEPDPSEEEPALDLCEAISAERVQELAGRDELPEVGEDGQAGAGEDGADIFECTYKWEPGETNQLIRISAIRDADNADAAEYVESILGPEHEPVDGVGEAAGIDREQRFGNQIAALAAAGQTEHGLAGVLVIGAEEFDTTVFTGIAAEAFGVLD